MAIEQEWWKNKLAEDIYATLRLKEQSLQPFTCQSPQLFIRRHLVDWLSLIVPDLDICVTAQHLAVYLLDRFMDGLEVEMCYIHLVALSCLLLAIKFEDHCERVPHYNKLNAYLHVNKFNGGQPYTARQYLSMELNVLQFCKFDLCIPTVPHFLPYFLKVAVDEDDLRDGLPITSKSKVETYLEKHATYFQEIVLQDVTFREYAPSLVASACVAAARICVRLTPTWPTQMELMTDYYLEQLLPCVHTMLIKHQQDSQQQSVTVLPMSDVYSSFNASYNTIHNQRDKLHPTFPSPSPYSSVISDFIPHQQIVPNFAESYHSARDLSIHHSSNVTQSAAALNTAKNLSVRSADIILTDTSCNRARDLTIQSSEATQTTTLYSSARDFSYQSSDLTLSAPTNNSGHNLYDHTSSVMQSSNTSDNVSELKAYVHVDSMASLPTVQSYSPYNKYEAGSSNSMNSNKSAVPIINDQTLSTGASYSSFVAPTIAAGPVTQRIRGS